MKYLFGCICLMLALLIASPTSAQSIFLVTDHPHLEAEGTGNLADYLRGLGYTVNTNEGAGGSNEYRGVLTADQIANLESHNLVIFHRSTDSGQFWQNGAKQQWNQLAVPLLNGSAYTARNDPERWDWVTGPQARDADSTLLEVLDSSHPIFLNVEIVNDFIQLFSIPQDVDAVNTNLGEGVGNGLLLAETEFNFHSALIVWDNPGPFVDGQPETFTHRRVLFSLSRYFEGGGQEFSAYTEAGLQLIANVVEYTMTGDVTGEPPTRISEWSIH